MKDILDRSLAALDWGELLDRLATRARSPRGAAACRALPLAADAAKARTRAELVAEMAGLLRAQAPVPGLAFPEIEPLLASAEKGLALGPAELTQVAAACETVEAVRRFFSTVPGAAQAVPAAPSLWALAARLEPCEDLGRRIRRTFDAAGEIRDEAAPELARLRRDREALSSHLRSEIERLIHAEPFAGVLQDEYFTIRGDRYVLPVKVSAQWMGLGIVHDTSRTGETVFVEPTSLVGANNRLKVTELEIQRESRRVLEELSAEVGAAVGRLRADLDMLTRFDVIFAQAEVSVAWGGETVEVTDAAEIHLRQLRHPLLVLRAAAERFEVVANDVVLGGAPGENGAEEEPARVLVVSGPNAGGKTVLLKGVGLAALAARAGLLLPVAPGSRIGCFDPILADVGDQQSVLGDLSTFSAHLANLADILRAGERATRPALVLLDELMAGTNPDQGAALARAALEAVAELSGLAIATTHYDALKALASSDPRFRNAGMEYDLDRLRPTFRLRDGVPGRSYAFDIAERIGLPPALIARARELASSGARGLEDVLGALETREADLAREVAALAQARGELAAAAGAERAATEALERRERELAGRAREALEEAIREAREALRTIVREAQQEKSLRAAESARRALEQAARVAVTKLPEQPPAPEAPSLRIGPRWAAQATPSSRAARRADKSQRGGAAARAGATAGEAAPHDALAYALPAAGTTLDLRGARADEALERVEAYLDRAAMEGTSPVFIIHGHGTGALKKAVRDYLASSPYVRRWSPGGKGQGGDGVSVVEL